MARFSINLSSIELEDFEIALPNASIDGLRMLMQFYGYEGEDAGMGEFFAQRIKSELMRDYQSALDAMTRAQNQALVNYGFASE